jgi:hypothetical protein
MSRSHLVRSPERPAVTWVVTGAGSNRDSTKGHRIFGDRRQQGGGLVKPGLGEQELTHLHLEPDFPQNVVSDSMTLLAGHP